MGLKVLGASLELYYKGNLPNALESQIGKIEKQLRVEIVVRVSNFSLIEVRGAAADVSDAILADPELTGVGVEYPVQGSHITLTIPMQGGGEGFSAMSSVDPAPGNPAPELSSAEVVTTINDAVPELRIPLVVEEVGGFETLAGDRFHSPGAFVRSGTWLAGYVSPTESTLCTAGFAVRMNGSQYMLTAGHCGYPNQPWWYGDINGAWKDAGRVTHENSAHDVMLIGGFSYSWQVWEDPYTPLGGGNRSVVRWDDVRPGELICVSGAETRQVCNIQVSDNFSYSTTPSRDSWGNWEVYHDLVIATHRDGRDMVTHGDSGGPVYRLERWENGDLRDIVAVGTVTGGYKPAFSSQRMVFQDMRTTWRDFGGASGSGFRVRTSVNP